MRENQFQLSFHQLQFGLEIPNSFSAFISIFWRRDLIDLCAKCIDICCKICGETSLWVGKIKAETLFFNLNGKLNTEIETSNRLPEKFMPQNSKTSEENSFLGLSCSASGFRKQFEILRKIFLLYIHQKKNGRKIAFPLDEISKMFNAITFKRIGQKS